MSLYHYPTSDAAEAAFYQAFEANNLEAMMQVWDDTDDLVCVHPMGQILHGRAAITESWREIFTGGANMRFAIEPVQTYAPPDHAMHIVTEHIEVPGSKRVAPMSAINLYRLTPKGWRMIAHHAAPAVTGDPAGQGDHAVLH